MGKPAAEPPTVTHNPSPLPAHPSALHTHQARWGTLQLGRKACAPGWLGAELWLSSDGERVGGSRGPTARFLAAGRAEARHRDSCVLRRPGRRPAPPCAFVSNPAQGVPRRPLCPAPASGSVKRLAPPAPRLFLPRTLRRVWEGVSRPAPSLLELAPFLPPFSLLLSLPGLGETSYNLSPCPGTPSPHLPQMIIFLEVGIF